MISVAELDNIARTRIEDATALLPAGRFDGATNLCSYAFEVALKARIGRTLNWTEFPLLRLSRQGPRIKQNHFPLWNAVARWTVELRHNAVGAVQQPGATAMSQAAEEMVAIL